MTSSHISPLTQTTLASFYRKEVPDSFRGAVLGFAALAPKNSGALCVSFGSPSVGLSHTLGRVFNRVSYCLVSVPDPKPTPARITFSIPRVILQAIHAPDEVWG